MLPAQWKYLEEHGRTGAFQRGTTPGFPEGATYSVCTDGIAKFMRSDIIFHPCENPGVYTDAEGKLRLLASYGSRGTWESETLDGGWCCSNPDFPPGGDCTFFFHWGEFDYIIGGFTGLWMKSSDAPVSAYEDMVRHGLDFYDGSNVPAVTEIAGGRFLMAAWIPIRGWGGNLLIRELLQLPDGRIGSKWMDEITPKAGKSMLLGKALSGTTSFPVEHRACMLVFEVHPAAAGEGRLALVFLPEAGDEHACELQIRPCDQRAQFAPGSRHGFAPDEQSLREGGAPQHAGNYAIEQLIGTGGPFTVRIMVKGCDKIGGSLVDAEIAGQRTMISYRPELDVRKLLFRLEALEPGTFVSHRSSNEEVHHVRRI